MIITDGTAKFEVRNEIPTMLGVTTNLGRCNMKPVSWLKEQIIATAAKTPIGHTSIVAGYNIGVMNLINVWNVDGATIPDGSHVVFAITAAIKASNGVFASVMVYSYGVNSCATFNVSAGRCSDIRLISLADSPTNLLRPINKTSYNGQPARVRTANKTPIGYGGGLEVLIATQDMVEGKPPTDGFILHLGWDYLNNYDTQLFIPNNSQGRMSYRMQKGDSTWGSSDWTTFQLAYLSDVQALRSELIELKARVAKLEAK